MIERSIILLILLAVAIGGGAGFLAAFRRSQAGTYRSWMLTSPPLVPVGRYWGLAPLAVMAATIFFPMLLIAAAHLSPAGMVGNPLVGIAVGLLAAGLVAALALSWKMPSAWIPAWFARWQEQGITREQIAQWLEAQQVQRRAGREAGRRQPPATGTRTGTGTHTGTINGAGNGGGNGGGEPR